MNRTTLLGVTLALSTLAGTAARADWPGRGQGRGEFHGRTEVRFEGQRYDNHHWEHRGWERRGWVEPVRARGHYETRMIQVWVPGVPTQVWVAGGCDQWGRCSQGSYQTVMTPGHYESRPQSVWVAGFGWGY